MSSVYLSFAISYTNNANTLNRINVPILSATDKFNQSHVNTANAIVASLCHELKIEKNFFTKHTKKLTIASNTALTAFHNFTYHASLAISTPCNKIAGLRVERSSPDYKPGVIYLSQPPPTRCQIHSEWLIGFIYLCM